MPSEIEKIVYYLPVLPEERHTVSVFTEFQLKSQLLRYITCPMSGPKEINDSLNLVIEKVISYKTFLCFSFILVRQQEMYNPGVSLTFFNHWASRN